MNSIVCIKQIYDPEIPSSIFKIDPAANRVLLATGIHPVVSTFDEYAVEAALRIREKVGGKITALSLGVNLSRDVVKKPLSMGVDELVLLEDPAFEDGDSWSTAFAISSAIRKIKGFDLIFCGRQAADSDSGQVGSGIAEILGLPCVTIVRKVDIIGNKARVERIISDGFELIEVDLPAVFTIGNEHPLPRFPNVRGIMMAKRIEPIVWTSHDIDADSGKIGFNGRRLKVMKLFKPKREKKCELISADTPEEAAFKLARRLRDSKVL
ncbi:MAG: electron transfer flavoprotein subunit beta/FixA family protein [Deltaproteobacteria bacterium]|nr:electron transfer flavoprotein subunit beta/FixA family protein [Deltaproteobacteria bacterium]